MRNTPKKLWIFANVDKEVGGTVDDDHEVGDDGKVVHRTAYIELFLDVFSLKVKSSIKKRFSKI